MKVLDLFSGIGGFRSGFEKAGFGIVGFVEWDKWARKSYKAIYNTEGEYEGHDIQKVKGSELPRADVWTFGSPAKISVLLEDLRDSKEKNQACSLKLSDSLKKQIKKTSLSISSWKMLKTCYQATEDGTLQGSSLKWNRSGMMWNGTFSTLPSSHNKIVRESTLSDILEKNMGGKRKSISYRKIRCELLQPPLGKKTRRTNC